MAWLLVLVAGVFETGFAVLLKQSHGITRVWPTVGFAICALISFGLLTIALRNLEVGPAYAVWTGIGAAGTALVGMAVLGESVSVMKLVSIGLILVVVVVGPVQDALELPPASVCAWVACVVLAAIAGLTCWRRVRSRQAG